jgi:hypothetical protein
MDVKGWEASLTGDLVCGHCSRVTIVHHAGEYKVGNISCKACGKLCSLSEEVIELCERRAKAAYPTGRPDEEGPRWKGEDPYDS